MAIVFSLGTLILMYNLIGLLNIVYLITAGLIFVSPRYILDLIRALRYNTKTRESDRLADLENQIAEIKRNQK